MDHSNPPAWPSLSRFSLSIIRTEISSSFGKRTTTCPKCWGASELEHIWEELQKRNATSANIVQLIFQANVTTLKMSSFGDHLVIGSENMQKRIMDAISMENRMRCSYGLQLLSSDDAMETHSYSFGGLSEVYESFMMDMAGVAEIPGEKSSGSTRRSGETIKNVPPFHSCPKTG